MILVTGAAGFIGFHVAQRLLHRGEQVVGLDNLNAYYDVRLKEARLQQLQALPQFQFERLDLADREAIASLFTRYPIRRVVIWQPRLGPVFAHESACRMSIAT